MKAVTSVGPEQRLEDGRAGRRATMESLALPLGGTIVLFMIWYAGGAVLASTPALAGFAGFAPNRAFPALWDMLASGYLATASLASFSRILWGLSWAIAIGVPIGLVLGLSERSRKLTGLPFQFLRMISPLSWMPIAVLLFRTWDSAIVFLLAAAAVWPIMYSTTNGISRLDLRLIKIARNLGASSLDVLRDVLLPAIAQDVLTGFRLALGVAWIILVPAEYLGVTSGLGYAINDARDTLEYERLAAIVVAIGVFGFTLDACLVALIKRFSWSRGE